METTGTTDYIIYTNNGLTGCAQSVYNPLVVNCGMDEAETGEWQTFVRDLNADLHTVYPDLDVTRVSNVLELMDYYPYGGTRIDERANDYENDYKYTGKELDADTNLYYYEARYYDPEIGRFTSIDPWGGDISDPQSLNKLGFRK